MRMLMVLCIAALLLVFAGCAALDLVLGTNFSEDPVTKEELAEPVAAAAEAAMPKIDPDTGAVTWNFNPVLILATAVSGFLNLLQKRRGAKARTISASMITGVNSANMTEGSRRALKTAISRLATAAGVETGRNGLHVLVHDTELSVTKAEKKVAK